MSQRQSNLVAVVLAIALVTAPVAAATGGTLTASATESAGWTGGVSDDVIRYSGQPGFHIEYSDGKFASLDDWAASSSDRQIIRHDNESNRAIVAAPSGAVGLSLLDRTLNRGLHTKGYVTEISLVREVSYPQPITTLDNESDWSTSTTERVARADRSPGGLAFDSDANKSDLATAKSAMGADGISADGDGVTVAVVDTGVNAYNATDDPLYEDRLRDPYNARTNKSSLDAVADGDGHGSWVTSAIAADPDPSTSDEAYEGVAPNASVVPIKALGDDGSGSTADIVRAIDYAEGQDADVVSMSLGSPVYMPAVADEIREALAGNVTTVVIASGNSGAQPHRLINSPADVDDALAVAASNTAGPDSARTAYFSSPGPDNGLTDASDGATNGAQPDLIAPGMKVTAPVMDTNLVRSNRSLSGTSMSTPLVSGVAAVMLDADPALENDTDATNTRLRDTASPAQHVGVTEAEHGMVNATNAVNNVQPETSQADARTDEAIARDEANRRYANSRLIRYGFGARDSVQEVAS